ncbi:MAG: 3-hydroxyacyl-ACP dehydratase FabZ family protein [Desulfobulbaceae bacterium]|nr:3-hydroxyacyl-ACP dehydratase FabZ family protein [Desulfobulbaceae bacterium]
MVAFEIETLIPHRPPFLWLDQILSLNDTIIVAEKFFSADFSLYHGHYPNYPITPGVILCEAVFQAGAALIAYRLQQEQRSSNGLPVLTRIYIAKFKRQVPPDSLVVLEAKLVEIVGPSWIMKGKVKLGGKTAVSVEFGCAEVVLQPPE